MFVHLDASEVTVRPSPGLVFSEDEADEALAQPRPQPVIGDFVLASRAYSEGSPTSTLSCGSFRLSNTLTLDYASHVASMMAPSKPPTPSFGRSNSKSAPCSAQVEAEAKDSPVQKRKQRGGNDGPNSRWWARIGPDTTLLCPLNNFPISLLPYPPFKLRMDPKQSSSHRLVDGKSLAMQVCLSRNITVFGRKLQASDLAALDDYVQRCKLGPFRPKRAAQLISAVKAASDKEARQHALKEHESFMNAARVELGKLRSIQENRMQEKNSVMSRCQQMAESLEGASAR